MAEKKSSKHAYSFIDHTGQRFGKLLVLSISQRKKPRYVYWDCLCDCGKLATVVGQQLRRGTISCGCYRLERVREVCTTHGRTGTREFNAWSDAKTRCFNRSNSHWKHYGGRGITMCDQWKHSFEQFLKDMGPCPDGYTLERNNVDGNYEASNCRWATRQEQMINRQDSVRITHNGVTRSPREWSEISGFKVETILYRHRHGNPLFGPLYVGRGRRKT